MRFLAVILSIHIVLLTLSPAFSVGRMDHGKKTCCASVKKQHTSKTPVKRNNANCKDGVCNPFMICCNCSALTTQVQAIYSPVSFFERNYALYNEGNNTGFNSEAWNPPKFS